MLRNIKLSVDKVYIDPNSTLVHTGTSYQVSRTPVFTVATDLIVNVANDTVNVLEYRFEHDLADNVPLYIRTRYHFNNGTMSSWSSIIELRNGQIGFKASSTVLSTPTITTSFDYTVAATGELVAVLSNSILYSGVGNIVSVSWTVETTDGILLYELPASTDVLTELRLPLTVLNGNTCIVVTATTHTDTNATSNPARVIAVLNTTSPHYFTPILKEALYVNSNNYIAIQDYTQRASSVDIRISTPDTGVIAEHLALDPYAPMFALGNLSINGYYIVEVRATVNNGTLTPWVECYRGPAMTHALKSYLREVTYDTISMNLAGNIDINGLSTQTIQADIDNVFYLAIPETTRLDAYRIQTGHMYPTGKSYDMGAGNMFNIPSMNYMNLPDGRILIDHSIAVNGGNIEVAKFTVLEYNHVDKSLSPVSGFIRTDERFGTGRSSSAVVMQDSTVYYVPGEMFDANGVAIDLELRIFDINTNSIIANIPLPVTGLMQNVTIAEDSNNDIYMFGGSGVDTTNTLHNELWANLLNNSIYKLDKVLNTWTKVATLNMRVASSYRYRMQTLKNGDLFIIDATPNLVDTPLRSSYIYTPSTGAIKYDIPNTPSKEHIGITVELFNGDIALISSTSDVVETVSYLRTTGSNIAINRTRPTDSSAVVNLVVPVGDTVYIRDPYRYASIVIEGTSLASTGTLVWIKDDVGTNYYYNDLIITRNMTITTPAAGPVPTFNNVVVVGDAQLTLVQL